MAAKLAGKTGGKYDLGQNSDINVTPFVDVMLVLLIIFMISAPLLTVGVPVDLPKTEAAAVDEQTEPLTISIQRVGKLYLQETATPFSDLAVRLKALAGDGFDKPIFVRADGAAPYAVVAQVMARLSTSGFTSINLITDTGAPPVPTKSVAAPPAATDPAPAGAVSP